MIVTHWKTAHIASNNFLESTPSSVNGVLTACASQQISLTVQQLLPINMTGTNIECRDGAAAPVSIGTSQCVLFVSFDNLSVVVLLIEADDKDITYLA